MLRALLAAAVAGLVAGAAFAAPAGATRPGPPLSEPAARLAASLHCVGDPAASARSGRTPVLMIHGTTSNFRANFSWNWDRAFAGEGRARCYVDLPDSGNGDIQVAAEHVVHGIRRLYAATGSRIDLLGHSQGGMIGRWALKYWPDTRGMVDDYVSLAASNHGTTVFAVQCATTPTCTAANWQQRTDSNFLAALNRGPQTWPGISYTQIYTRHDEIVVPSGSSSLPPAPNVSNIAVQDLCRYETVEHFGMAYDNAAWLLGMDALVHPGPALLHRTSPATCGRPLMPAVNPVTFLSDASAALTQSVASTAAAPVLPEEPPLRCYAAPACPRLRAGRAGA
ncbi:esterase/lipase family protein [Actinoplanes sp. NPDC049668]|uniref:esterase/lipase family protein n=1 Tax=unclassified Actinoplanes TaxID=2626549 RepID=UPI0033BB19A1